MPPTELIADSDPEYFEKLKGVYVDGTFGPDGALGRKEKELIMVGISCALRVQRGVRIHADRALTLGVRNKSRKPSKWPRSPEECRDYGLEQKPSRKF